MIHFFIYVVLCDDKKEFIIHRILYEAGCDGDFMTLSSRRPSYFSSKAVFPSPYWTLRETLCNIEMPLNNVILWSFILLWQIDFQQRIKEIGDFFWKADAQQWLLVSHLIPRLLTFDKLFIIHANLSNNCKDTVEY